MRYLTLTESNPPKGASAQSMKLLVSHGGDFDWGEFEPLRGTSWESGVGCVTGAAFSHALHGDIFRLLREFDADQHSRVRTRVLAEEGLCVQRKTCPLFSSVMCRPGGKAKKELGPADCYEPPLVGADPKTIEVFREVAKAWKNGFSVIAVQGAEYNLR